MYTRDMHTHQTHLSPPPTQNVKIIPKCQFCFICVCRCVRMTNRWNSEIDAFFYVGMLHFYEFTAACFDSSFFFIYICTCSQFHNRTFAKRNHAATNATLIWHKVRLICLHIGEKNYVLAFISEKFICFERNGWNDV